MFTPKPSPLLSTKYTAPVRLSMTEMQEYAHLKSHRHSIDEELQRLRKTANKDISKEIQQAYNKGAQAVYGHWKFSVTKRLGGEMLAAGVKSVQYNVIRQTMCKFVNSDDDLQHSRIPEFKSECIVRAPTLPLSHIYF